MLSSMILQKKRATVKITAAPRNNLLCSTTISLPRKQQLSLVVNRAAAVEEEKVS